MLRFYQRSTFKKSLVILICLWALFSSWRILSTAKSRNPISKTKYKVTKELLHKHHLSAISTDTEINRKLSIQSSSKQEYSLNVSAANETMATKHILLKNIPPWPLFEFGVQALKTCSSKCSLFKSGDNLTIFDAIVFNAVNYGDDHPPRKTPGQVWVYFTLEPPLQTMDYMFNNAEWRNKINWTMTYRADSDIYYPYGHLSKRTIRENINYLAIAKNKTKLVAWFVSNCHAQSKRHRYVDEMRKTISVHIYGLCGHHKCHRDKCHKMLSQNYKFYLSFENSFCYDYVTEKAYHYMTADIVPVVRGGANYTRFLPAKSYINTADFNSPKELTEYLHYLDKNNSAYVEFFQWKKHYTLDKGFNGMCKLCKKLSNPKISTKVYSDVYSWWHKGTCFRPNDIG